MQLSACWDNEGIDRQATAHNECGGGGCILLTIRARTSLTVDWQTFVVMTYIGSTSASVSRSNSALWSTSVYMAWHRHTCLNCAGRPATSKDAVNCAVWAVPADLQHRRTPSTALCDLRRPRCAKMLTINVRQTGVLLCRSGSMELFSGSFEKQYITIIQFRRLLKSFLFSTY